MQKREKYWWSVPYVLLGNWEALEAPPVWLVYRKSLRNTARAKAFSAFVKDALARMEKSLIGVPSPTPHYYRQPWGE